MRTASYKHRQIQVNRTLRGRPSKLKLSKVRQVRETSQSTSRGIWTLRPTSSVSSRPGGSAARAALVCAAKEPSQRIRNNTTIPAQNAASRCFRNSAFTRFGARSLESNIIISICCNKNKKSPARNTGHIKPHPFSRRVPAAAAWEGVLTFGVSPITVAGPWPILTAFPRFPNLLNVESKSMLRDERCQQWASGRSETPPRAPMNSEMQLLPVRVAT